MSSVDICKAEIEQAGRLQVAKYKCLRSQLFFTRYFYKQREKRKYVVGRHHEIIAGALDRVFKGECKRLIINIAPRYGKTELAVKNFMAKGLALNPAARFIHLSYSDDLALDNSEAVRDMVQADEYQTLYPGVQIKKDSKAKKKWYTTAGGGVYATAAAGQVTGFGAGKVDEEDEDEQSLDEFLADSVRTDEDLTDLERMQRFGGALIVDDPIKPEDADSDTVRDRINSRWDSTISNRVNSRNTPIIIIMQRLHENDLCGYLIERDGRIGDGGEWEVISLPCLYTDENDAQQALWPFKHTVDELLKLKDKNEVVFGRQYMQDPQPLEGLLFPKKKLRYYDPKKITDAELDKLAEFKFFTTDPADDGGDDLSAPFGYLAGTDVYIPHAIYNTDGVDVNEPELVHQIVSRRMHAGAIEGNSAWKLFAVAVRNKVQALHDDCDIRIIKNSTNKHTRILAMASFIANHFVFRSDWEDYPNSEYYKFMKVLTSYMKVQQPGRRVKDDSPDSLAEMAQYFQTNFTHIFT